MHIAHLIFGILGNLTSLFLFLAPAVRIKKILKHKSTKHFSVIPYLTILMSNLLSAWYGLPLVSPNNILVTTVNGIGAVIEIVYVMVFLILAPKKEKLKIGGLLTLVLSFFAAFALISFFALHDNTRKIICGITASAFLIIMYSSPLCIMRPEIKTKSAEYLPFLLSLFSILSGTCWLVYGVVGGDPYVAVPNGFGSALGLVEVGLSVIYCFKRIGERNKISSEHPPEMDAFFNGDELIRSPTSTTVPTNDIGIIPAL